MPTPSSAPSTPGPAAPAPRRVVSHRVLGAVSGVVLLAAAGFVAGGLATWNDTVELPQSGNTIGEIGFALVGVTGGGSAVTTTFGPFVPGDSGYRYVGVQSSSASSLGGLTLDATLDEPPVTDSFGDEATAAELTDNLTVNVSVCATGWSAAAASTCAAGWTVSSIDGVTLSSLLGTPTTLDEALPADANPVGVRIELVAGGETPASVMGASMPITWNFTASARAGVSSK